MKKPVIILLIFILAAYTGIFYLNQTIVPTKVKAMIVKELEDATGKKVILGSVQFSVLKGLVLKDLIISDDLNAIINVKETHCRFLLIPLFNKKIIFSRIVFESPEIFVERRPDKSFNIFELFPKGSAGKAMAQVLVRRVSVKRAMVTFHDLTLDPLYSKEVKDFDAEIKFSLPNRIKYDLKFNIPSEVPIGVDSSGEYSIASKELSAEIRVKYFSPKEFSRYYEKSTFSFPRGRFDTIINVKYKNEILSADLEFDTKGLDFEKDALAIKINGSGHSNLQYYFVSKKMDYTGNVNIRAMSISGIEYIEKIDQINGRIEFSNLGLSSDNMTAVALGMPFGAKVSANDLSRAVINIDATSDIKLAVFQDMLKEKFALDIPARFNGDAKLRLELQYAVSNPESLQIKSYIYMSNAMVSANKGKDILKNVTGQFQIVPNQVSWDDIGFRYHDIHYRSSGTLTDFKMPGIQLKLDSNDISINAIFALTEKSVNFSKFSGKIFNSNISARGSLDATDPASLKADVKGSFAVDLSDLEKPLDKYKDKFERVRPKGVVHADFGLKGDLKDLKNCFIEANLSSDELSLFGFKLATTTMNYNQKNGAGEILFMRSFLYGGSMGATGRIVWLSKGVPYHFNLNIDGVKIEKFKADTSLKDSDIAGTVKLQAKIRGVFADADKLTGEGKIAVTEGKLWQLNLFKGLGVLIFTRDFSNIMFKEGHCDFDIFDKSIYTGELNLKSDLVDIYGPLKIGFDTSVNATFKAEFSDDAIASGFKKSITAAIGNYTLTEVTGTLKEPKYKTKADMENIVESIAERFSGE